VFTAEIAESAEMTERENLNRIRKSIIGAAIEVHRVGLLINFNVKVLKDGIRRMVNDFPDSRRSQRSLR